MKTLILITSLIIASPCMSSAQLVAKLSMKERVEGICNHDAVYALFSSFENQEEPGCPMTKDEILEKLNEEVAFLKDHPKFKAKGMIGLLINCHGALVQCEMDNTTGNEELDRQIESVFSTLKEWNPGTLNGSKVDASVLYSFKVKKGKIYLG